MFNGRLVRGINLEWIVSATLESGDLGVTQILDERLQLWRVEECLADERPATVSIDLLGDENFLVAFLFGPHVLADVLGVLAVHDFGHPLS